MGERGQISLEALIIVGIFILILVGVSLPMTFHAKRTATDVTVITDARYATGQIAAAANSVVTPGAKRTLDVYIPGYRSNESTSLGNPLFSINTTLGTDGDDLTSTVTVVRRYSDDTIRLNETYNMTEDLYGIGWKMYDNTGAEKAITEGIGRRYSIIITWKNGIKNITWSRIS